jgi:hypothetical protein
MNRLDTPAFTGTIRFGLPPFQVCELVRIALGEHTTPVSRIVAICLRKLVAENPKLRAVVSFADPQAGHVGAVYQAGNWIYAGMSTSQVEYLVGGKWRHARVAYRLAGKDEFPDLCKRKVSGKFRYVMPLDAETRAQVLKDSQPYPKRDAREDPGLGTQRPLRGEVRAAGSRKG